jgi:glycosyltransferase involved in cell wall biosynthesis
MINYSFIIPHRNSPELLNRCLNSIPKREDIEIIVVDDNSDEDKKPSVCRNDVQSIFIDSEHSKGAGRARNVGMEKAKGKWLLFADCDDFYEKDFIFDLDKYIDSDCDLVIFDAFFHYDMETGKCSSDYYKEYIENFLLFPDSRYNQLMLKLGNYSTWMRMYSHSFIKKIGVQYDEVPACNDGWFVQYAGVHARKIAAIPKKLYYYVQNQGSITTRKQPKSVVLQKRRVGYKIHRLLAKHNAYCAIWPYFHGIRGIYRTYGFLFTVRVLWDKIRYDISPVAYFYHKYLSKQKYD